MLDAAGKPTPAATESPRAAYLLVVGLGEGLVIVGVLVLDVGVVVGVAAVVGFVTKLTPDHNPDVIGLRLLVLPLSADAVGAARRLLVKVVVIAAASRRPIGDLRD